MQMVAQEAVITVGEPSKKGIMLLIAQKLRLVMRLARKAILAFLSAKTWKMKRNWIAAIVGLRLAY